SVPVVDGDNVETLARRVLTVEHQLYVDTVKAIIDGEIDLQ
ncbi:MAG: phosphoribosylglycinamide formyltransferase, partial [Gammaproteobacteria bacterium]|nr:phosphoribosylglycinamide formyltransferase [Gammaproteobacteria bacterium]